MVSIFSTPAAIASSILGSLWFFCQEKKLVWECANVSVCPTPKLPSNPQKSPPWLLHSSSIQFSVSETLRSAMSTCSQYPLVKYPLSAPQPSQARTPCPCQTQSGALEFCSANTSLHIACIDDRFSERTPSRRRTCARHRCRVTGCNLLPPECRSGW